MDRVDAHTRAKLPIMRATSWEGSNEVTEKSHVMIQYSLHIFFTSQMISAASKLRNNVQTCETIMYLLVLP